MTKDYSSSTRVSPTSSSKTIDPNRQRKVGLITDWYLNGMRYSEMPEFIAKHPDKWEAEPPSQTELLELIDEAQETIASDSTVDVDKENAKSIARLNNLYARCLAIQDYKGAASIDKAITAAVARVETRRFLQNG